QTPAYAIGPGLVGAEMGISHRIEHNIDLMLEADHIIDLGTGGGAEGGSLVYQGSVGGLLMEPASRTGRCIREYISALFCLKNS
ncbi:MAG: hypothetical protein K1W26_02810, partial [Acetatifactor sp.]